MNNNISKLKEAYKMCKEAKVGETIVCPSCGTSHVKKSYQSVFCKSKKGTKCKDNYWNNVDENKRNNVSRFSPASIRWSAMREIDRNSGRMLRDLNGNSRDYDPHDDDHPFSSDALGQWCD